MPVVPCMGVLIISACFDATVFGASRLRAGSPDRGPSGVPGDSKWMGMKQGGGQRGPALGRRLVFTVLGGLVGTGGVFRAAGHRIGRGSFRVLGLFVRAVVRVGHVNSCQLMAWVRAANKFSNATARSGGDPGPGLAVFSKIQVPDDRPDQTPRGSTEAAATLVTRRSTRCAFSARNSD
jgi:hypothetical protein